MIELGKFCFIKTKFEPNSSCFSNKRLSRTMCEVSAVNFGISLRKYAMKKMHISCEYLHGKILQFNPIF